MSAEDRYRALLLHTPDPILTVDRDARVIASNPVACLLFGATESGLMRTQILLRVPPEEQRAAATLLMRAFQGRTAEERITFLCDKGTRRVFLLRVIPIPQRGGTPIVTMLLRDVTDRDRLLEQSRRGAHLERTPGQFMLTLDLFAKVVHAIGLDETLGHRDAEWEGRDVRELVQLGEHHDEIFASVETDLADVGSWAAVQHCVRADGSAVPFHLFATPRVDPVTKEPLGCYLSGIAMIERSATGEEGAAGARPAVPRVHRTLPALGTNVLPSVLVIEDDEQMRGLVRRYLERAGYGVVEAKSGREGMRLLRDGAAVHFVVTDLKMADGSGGWLMAQVGYEFPALLPRTIVISGEAQGAAAAHVAVRWKCPVLAKPFDAAELVDTLVRLAAA